MAAFDGEFSKIPRLDKEVVITEKIDGTHGVIKITEWNGEEGAGLVHYFDGATDWVVRAGSRNRWIDPLGDNYGFAKWVWGNVEDLVKLGEGTHHGEWWGKDIQRGYGLGRKVFSLFNTHRWADPRDVPVCCSVVPVLGCTTGLYMSEFVNLVLGELRERGSVAAPGFMNPEGVVVYHTAAGQLFKVTLENDMAKSLRVVQKMEASLQKPIGFELVAA